MVTKSVWGCKWGKTIHDHWSLINGPKIAKTHCSSAGRWYGWDWGLEWKFCKNDPLSFLTNQAPYLLNFNISGELPSAPASERCDLRHQRTKVELNNLSGQAWCYHRPSLMLHGGVYQLQYQPCHDALGCRPVKGKREAANTMVDANKWHQVASIPTSGINGNFSQFSQ